MSNRTLEIDWSKAPNGAEEAGFDFNGNLTWYRSVSVDDYYFFDENTSAWSRRSGNPVANHREMRPVFWTGEGFPPVGTQLEHGFSCENFKVWHVGVCVAVGEDPEGREEFCVVKSGNKIANYSAEGKRMRPIRTAEQIAADQRDSAIRQFSIDLDVPIGIAERAYDAGYRKQAIQ